MGQLFLFFLFFLLFIEAFVRSKLLPVDVVGLKEQRQTVGRVSTTYFPTSAHEKV